MTFKVNMNQLDIVLDANMVQQGVLAFPWEFTYTHMLGGTRWGVVDIDDPAALSDADRAIFDKLVQHKVMQEVDEEEYNLRLSRAPTPSWFDQPRTVSSGTTPTKLRVDESKKGIVTEEPSPALVAQEPVAEITTGAIDVKAEPAPKVKGRGKKK